MRIVSQRLQGHGVVQLERVDAHTATRVDRGRPESAHSGHTHTHPHGTCPRRERRCGRRAGGAMPRRCKNASAGIDHPVADLAHAQASRVAQLLLLLL